MQAYRTMTAAMMRIIIPVTSPPRYAPTTVAVFEVGLPSSSSCSGIDVGLGCDSGIDVGLGCGSGVQEGLHTLTMVAV